MDWLAVAAVALGTWPGQKLGWLPPLPSPRRMRLALANIGRRITQRPREGFRVVVCWLEDDRTAATPGTWPLRSPAVPAIKLIRSARVVKAPPEGQNAWIPEMQRRTRKPLSAWNADLVVAGVVRKPGEVLSLWVVPRFGQGTLVRADKPYALEHMTLGRDFRDDFRQQLIATALTAVAPLATLGARGRMLNQALKDSAANLDPLAHPTAQPW